MKRLVALTLAVLMVAALLCACGEKKTADSTSRTVTTTVEAKYDDGVAKDYAKSYTVDSDGNSKYEFDEKSYDSFVYDYENNLGAKIRDMLNEGEASKYVEYVYFKEDISAVMVGVIEGRYNAAAAEEEAKSIADLSFHYYKSIENPISTLTVIYCERGNQDAIYGQFEYTAE